MTFRMNAAAVACLVAGLFANQSTHAATQTLSGQFLDLSYDATQIPSTFGQISLVETSFQWNCSASSCTMVAPPSVSIVFGSATGHAVATTQSSLDFRFETKFKSSVNVVDPLGHSWGIAAADGGKWEFGANIASQQAPADAAFATAYGQFQGYVAARPTTGRFTIPTWANNEQAATGVQGWTPTLAFTEGAEVLGLNQNGWIGFGPGAQGITLLDAEGQNLGDNDTWRLRANLASAYYATPSKTNPRCQSLSCMGFAEGTLNVDSYEFKLAVVASPISPVPEAGTGAMVLAGIGMLSLTLSRRRTKAA